MLAILIFWKLPNLKLEGQNGCFNWFYTQKKIQLYNLKVSHKRSYLSSSFPIHDTAIRKMDNMKGWNSSPNSYNKTNEIHEFLKFIFGIELYMFRTGFLSIIGSLVPYTQK